MSIAGAHPTGALLVAAAPSGGVAEPVVIAVVAAACSLTASWVLVSRLHLIGEHLHLSEPLVGLVAALAADGPEITSAVTAVVEHQRAIGIGVVLGSNVFNLAALLGLGALIAGRLVLGRRELLLSGSVALVVGILCMVAVSGVLVPAAAAAISLAVLVPYAIVMAEPRWLWRAPRPLQRHAAWLRSAIREVEEDAAPALPAGWPITGPGQANAGPGQANAGPGQANAGPGQAKAGPGQANAGPGQANAGPGLRGVRRHLAGAVTALVVVVVASAVMERATSSLGAATSLSSIVVGGVLLAAVTSLPNAVAAVHLARNRLGAAVLSEAMNSNSGNVVFGLLLPAAVVGLARPLGTGELVAGWYLATTVVALAIAYASRGLGRLGAGVVVAGYVAFVVTVSLR